MSEGTQEELERQRARWWATVSSGDLDGYLALFAEDAVWVTPELDEIAGREAIRAWLEPVFAQFDYELTITVADVRVAGSLGIERARFVSRMTPKPPSVRPVPSPPVVEAAPEPEPVQPVEPEPFGSGWGSDESDRVEPDSSDESSESDESASTPDAELGVPATGSGGDEDTLAADSDGGEHPTTGAEGGDEPMPSFDEAPPEDEPVVDAPVDEEHGEHGVDHDDEDDEQAVEAPLVSAGPDGAEDEPHEGRYLMYWRWHEDTGWLVHRYADVTGVG